MVKLPYLHALNMIPYLGPKSMKALREYFPDPEEAWRAPPGALRNIPGWGKLTAKFVADRAGIRVEEEWKKIKNSGIVVLSMDDPRYPLLLKEIYSPPPVIYADGEFREEELRVAMVGSRKSTLYGREIASKLSGELAAMGIVIVSGMAMGIDTWSHQGALDVGGRTIAVLGSGVDVCYPARNRRLRADISRRGAVISEFPPGTTPLPQNFPQRNRIISGISLGVVVVEAMERSGALITADFALEQGREVFAVPGNINSPYSRGCNRLIKQGAKLVETVDDILEELDHFINKKETTGEVKQMTLDDAEEERMLMLIPFQPIHFDEIVRLSGLPSSRLNGILLNLELKGFLNQLPGKYFVRMH